MKATITAAEVGTLTPDTEAKRQRDKHTEEDRAAGPDYAFKGWEVEALTAGLLRRVMKTAFETISDSSELCYFLGEVAEILTVSPGDIVETEKRRMQGK